MITERIEKRRQEKDELQGLLAMEMGKQVVLTAPQVRAYLYALKKGDLNNESTRRGIINIFLQAVYLYDDRMTLIFNGGEQPITLDDVLLDEIEGHLESAVSYHEKCSPLVADAPPSGLAWNASAFQARLFILSCCLMPIRSRAGKATTYMSSI